MEQMESDVHLEAVAGTKEKWWCWAAVRGVRIEKEGEIFERLRRLDRTQGFTGGKGYRRARSCGRSWRGELGL